METVDDPGVVALELEQAHPGRVRFHRHGLLVREIVDETPPPRDVREGAPFRRDKRRVVPVLARADDPRMLIQGERDLRLERESRPFEYDLWTELLRHRACSRCF